MKAIGTKTPVIASDVAMIGPVTSRMAATVASRGLRPSPMLRWTFSTTTIASSTTIPMARINPNRDSTLIENPKASISENVPTMDTGTASSGMSAARQVCRKTMTTTTTRPMASRSVLRTALMESETKTVGS